MSRHTIPSTRSFALLFFAGAMSAGALADPTQGLSRLGLDVRVPARGAPGMRALEQPESSPESALTIGVAYDRPDAGGHTWSTPFEYDFAPNGKQWGVTIQGAGVEWLQPSGGASVSGVADVTLLGSWQFVDGGKEHWSLGAALGYNFPTHGDVGSTSGSVIGQAVVKSPTVSNFNLTIAGLGTRDDSVAPGTSRYTEILRPVLGYAISESSSASFAVQRSHNSSSGGTTSLVLAFKHEFSKTLAGFVTLNRGLSRGQEDTGLELDVEMDF